MDQFLFERWQKGEKPFDELSLHPDDLIPLNSLTLIAQTIIQQLEQLYPSQELLMYHDWHEHDGYITSSKPVSWKQLKQIISSDQSLYENRPGDTFVRLAFYSSDLSFLFRMSILDEDEDDLYPGRWGDFDITGKSQFIADLAEKLRPLFNQPLLQEPAKAYFNRTYAG